MLVSAVPWVSTQTSSKLRTKAPVREMMMFTKMTGLSIGSSTRNNRFAGPAPSISAASLTSRGNSCSPAR